MTRVLRIDASARTQGSHTRNMVDFFQAKWLERFPGDEFVMRDLAADPVPHVTDTTIAGFFADQDRLDPALAAATALSDVLIDELMSADVLLIGAPMYNFSVPSVLKAYIDQIVRIGRTFGFDPEKGLYGMVEGKRAYVVTATGAVFSGGALDALDFLAPYLRTLLGFLGITDVAFIALEGTTTDEAALARSRQAARERIARLLAA